MKMASCQASFNLVGIFSLGNVLGSRAALFQKQFCLLCSIATGKINSVRLELMLCKIVYSWKLELGKKLYRATTGDQLWPNVAF